MTSAELSPLPSGTGPTGSAPRPSPPLPDLPARVPEHPAPERPFEIPPFGETEGLPPEKPDRVIPPLRSPRNNGDEVPDYTDHDLAEALLPLVKSIFPSSSPLDAMDLEAMMRATFRRALSEQSSGPFDRPGFVQRCLWRFDALLSSRSYDEILHDKTRRFRIEEVHLFDHERLALISFASTDPARHASARKTSPTAHRVAARMRNPDGSIAREFAFEKGRRVLAREGRDLILAALVRGEPDALAKADLDYALARIEEHFVRELKSGTPLLQEIQPYLEECLLIHSPAAPVAF